jgi:hypothetical protein
MTSTGNQISSRYYIIISTTISRGRWDSDTSAQESTASWHVSCRYIGIPDSRLGDNKNYVEGSVSVSSLNVRVYEVWSFPGRQGDGESWQMNHDEKSASQVLLVWIIGLNLNPMKLQITTPLYYIWRRQNWLSSTTIWYSIWLGKLNPSWW